MSCFQFEAFTGEKKNMNHYLCVCFDSEMDDIEREDINEELIEFAIRESIQDSYKLPCTHRNNR